MKKVLLLLALMLIAVNSWSKAADIVFSKFELEWFSVMGFRGGGDGQRLKLSFKNTSRREIKYVTVFYWAINAVNDITADKFNRREFSVNCTGPFVSKKRNKLEVDIVLFYPTLLKAYPYKVEIIYMDGEEKEVRINKDNLKEIFPCLEHIKVGNLP